jgi:hypothetical protein
VLDFRIDEILALVRHEREQRSNCSITAAELRAIDADVVAFHELVSDSVALPAPAPLRVVGLTSSIFRLQHLISKAPGGSAVLSEFIATSLRAFDILVLYVCDDDSRRILHALLSTLALPRDVRRRLFLPVWPHTMGDDVVELNGQVSTYFHFQHSFVGGYVGG